MKDLKYILTRYNDGVLSFVYDNNKNCFERVAYNKASETGIGDIFVAKVINVVSNINAAFINYLPKQKGYLPIDSRYEPVLLNRKYDGRILAGDEIIVQLEKEAVRSKEPTFTTNLSLTGKYCVVTNGNLQKSVSKKCSKFQKEKLMCAIPDDIKYGVVIRTGAAELLQNDNEPDNNENLAKITNECIYLNAVMDKLINEGIHRTCYSCIKKNAPLYLTDMLGDTEIKDYTSISTDDEELYKELKEFLPVYVPEFVSKLSFYEDKDYPLNKLYNVDTRVKELLSKKVWLKSGAYIVIEKTEAMYVIDVNSGKNIAKKNYEQYVHEVNMEAAVEIMRQIRLRNLTGIIIVDFINVYDDEKDSELVSFLRKLAKQDRIPTTVVDITKLGLIEITRKKTTRALNEQLLLA